jgi:hypothetical protein
MHNVFVFSDRDSPFYVSEYLKLHELEEQKPNSF